MHPSISVSQEQLLVHGFFQFMSPLKNQNKIFPASPRSVDTERLGEGTCLAHTFLSILCLF